MTRQGIVVLGLLILRTSFAAEGYPQDVAAYIERRDICEHFRQEPWPEGASVGDKERRKLIASQYDRYCRGSDQALQKLKRKYMSNQAVMDRLEKYEAIIEGSR